MKFENTKQHSIDILFVLSLFCVFAFCSVTLIIFGANIYQNTIHTTGQNYLERTSIAYLTEKIRQTDITQSVSIVQNNGIDMLTIDTNIDGQIYSTRLYEYEGYLYESFSRSDIFLSPDVGQKIFEIKDLTFSFLTPSLLQISFCGSKQEIVTFYINL